MQIEFYANPTQPTSAGVLKIILDEFLSRVEVGRVAGIVTVTQLLENGILAPEELITAAGQIGLEMGRRRRYLLAITSAGHRQWRKRRI